MTIGLLVIGMQVKVQATNQDPCRHGKELNEKDCFHGKCTVIKQFQTTGKLLIENRYHYVYAAEVEELVAA